MKKKIVVTVLFLVAFFSMAAVANAAVLSSQYIDSCDAQVERFGNEIKVAFNIRGLNIMNVIGAQTIIIQEKAPGSTRWTSIETMTSYDYPNMLSCNTRQYNSSISYYGAKSGYSYRAKVYFYAEKGGYDTVEFITEAA